MRSLEEANNSTIPSKVELRKWLPVDGRKHIALPFQNRTVALAIEPKARCSRKTHKILQHELL